MVIIRRKKFNECSYNDNFISVTQVNCLPERKGICADIVLLVLSFRKVNCFQFMRLPTWY